MLIPRMIRALKLDATLFEEVEHDPSAMGQAASVVLIASVMSGIGGAIFKGGEGFIGGIIASLIGWVAWSGVTYLVGTSLFGGKADMGEMLRALGFAYTPWCLGIVPVIGHIAGFFLSIAAMVIATRQALDFTTGKAVGTVVIGVFAYAIVLIVLAFLRILF